MRNRPKSNRIPTLVLFGTLLLANFGQQQHLSVAEASSENGGVDEINQLLESAEISIPGEFPLSNRVGIFTLDLVIRNVVCSDLSVGDVTISHERTSGDQETNIGLELAHVGLRCNMQYNYRLGFIRGSGTLDLIADDSSASTGISFQSQDFNAFPPTTSTPGDCVANVEITSIDFQGDFLSELAELFQGPVSNIIEGELEQFACDELGSLDLSSLDQDVLGNISDELAQYIAPLTAEERNPILLEDSLDIPPDMAILDLQNTTNNASDFLNRTVTLLADVLSGETNGTLDVNDFFRSNFLEDDGCLTLSFTQLELNTTLYDTHNDLVELFIALDKIRVCGLDSLETSNILMPNGKYTLRNEMSWKRLSLHLGLTIDMLPSSLETAIFSGPTSAGVQDSIMLDVALDNVDIVASLLLVIKEEEMSLVTLGALLRDEDFLACALNIFHTIQLSGLEVNPDILSNLNYNLTTNGSAGFTSLLEGALDAAYSLYEGVLETTAEAIFQRGITAELNAIIKELLTEAQASGCESVRTFAEVSEPAIDYVDFRELFGDGGGGGYSTIPVLARTLLNGFLGSSEQFNNLLSLFLSEDQYDGNGNFALGDSLVNSSFGIAIGGLVADLELQLKNATLQNVDSLGQPTELLNTVADHPYLLANTMTLGTEQLPLQMKGNLYFSLVGGDDGSLKNDVTVSVAMNAFQLEPLLLLMIEASRLDNFPIQNILEVGCWLATIPAPELDRYGVSVSNAGPTAALRALATSIDSLTINVTCNECSSPKMSEWPDVLATPQAQADLAIAMANSITYLGEAIAEGALLQNTIDQTLNDAARQCPHNPAYAPNAEATVYEVIPITPVDNEDSQSFLTTLLIIALVALLLVTALGFALKWFVKRRYRTWLATLPQDRLAQLASAQQKKTEAAQALDAATDSMFTSPQVPIFLRWGMPFIILMNIAFFLSGHLSLGATVNIQANIFGEQLSVDKFFEFSMARSIVDLWEAGGKELAVILLIFSGIWPYTKQLITLTVWFLPPSKLSTSRRESILLGLDRFGKWSMIDIFVLVISIVGFRVSVQSPNSSFFPVDFYSIDLLVVPLWGLYANMIAQLISQVSSHFIIHYHREIIREANARLGNDKGLGDTTAVENGEVEEHRGGGSDSIALYEHEFCRLHRGDKSKLMVRNWVNKMLVLVAVCIASFVVVGCIISSFSLDIYGVIGVAVESGQGFEDATTDHTVFTVLTLLMDEAKFLGGAGNYIGLGVWSALFVLTVLVVPIVEAGVLSFQWFSNSTKQKKMKLSVLIEILDAWQYTEVYLISLMLASWQLGPLSEFMINDYCGGLDATFSDLVNTGLLKEEDGQCFRVQSTLKAGFWIILAGAVLLRFMGSFVTKALTQFLRDKKEEAEKGNGSNVDVAGSDTSIDDIHPAPVLFSDSFRWMLKSQQ